MSANKISNKQQRTAVLQFNKLKNTRIQDLWTTELEAFVAEYGRYEAQRHEEMLETKPSATAKSSKKRARESIR